jgi:RHS repeat-associated protein
LTNGTLQLYLDGRKLTNITGTLPPYPFEWEIAASGGSYTLPAPDIAVLKHFRIYDRTATDAEVWANYKNSCLAPVDALAVQSSPLQYWGRFNIPPPGSATTTGPGSTTEYVNRFIVPDHGLPTYFAYNSLNQVIKQTSPDGGTSVFNYDRLGRLIISQNEEQKTPKIVDAENPANRYSYTKYDALGRITVVGEKVAPSSIVNEDLVRSFPVDGHPDENDPYYTSNPNPLLTWFASGTNRQVTVTAYDVQPAWAPASLTGTQKNLRMRVVASAILSTAANNPDPSQNRIAASYYSYDLIGSVNTLVQENTTLATAEPGSNGLKTIKYQYDLVTGKVNRVLYQDGKWDQFYYAYLYDADNRVISAWSSRTNIGNPSDGNLEWVKEATYRYYLHGPLARMELSRQKVQGVDYAYTLQGWLKGVNSQKIDPVKDMSGDGLSGSQFSTVARDVYGFSLGYFNKNPNCSVDPNASDLNLDGNDYKPIGGTGSNAFDLQYQDPCYDRHHEVRNFETGKNLFNGNIGNTTYAIKQLENGSTVGYTYRYDQLNRITGMRRNNIGAGATTWNNTSIIEAYKEEITYDANGNIKTYLRNGNQSANNYGMDNMTYNYNLNGSGKLVNNKLRHVDDAVLSDPYPNQDIEDQDPDNYQYDNIGNLISDNKENLQRINWTMYRKISTITKVNGSTITYTYDLMGNRISKTWTAAGGGSDVTTYYIRDAQGNVMGLYTKDATTHKWVEQHLYGSSRLGMATPDLIYNGNQAYVSSGDPLASGNVGKRIYELNNHLDNVLVTVSDIATGFPDGHFEATVLSASDYYPFGMLQPGRKYSAGLNYRYGFNGKENDNDVKGIEGSQQDYGMRIYDPRLGKFLSVDPLSGNYPEYTPYQYAENCPIKFIDLDGLESSDPSAKPTGITYISRAKVPNGIMEEKAAYTAGNYQLFKTNASGEGGDFYTARQTLTEGRYKGMYQDDWIVGPESVSKFIENAKEYEKKASWIVLGYNMGGSDDLSPGGFVDVAKDTWNPENIIWGLSIAGKGVVSMGRPTWRQSENDILKENPGYRKQVSFKNGQEVKYGTEGSVRPEGYQPGATIEVKNYNVTTESGKASLISNVVEQVKQRASNLPPGTTQRITLDLRGQFSTGSDAARAYFSIKSALDAQLGPGHGVLLGFRWAKPVPVIPTTNSFKMGQSNTVTNNSSTTTTTTTTNIKSSDAPIRSRSRW